jgi:hypothetical protein
MDDNVEEGDEKDDIGVAENEVEVDDVEEVVRSQDREPHLVRARPVEMHLEISQEPF